MNKIEANSIKSADLSRYSPPINLLSALPDVKWNKHRSNLTGFGNLSGF